MIRAGLTPSQQKVLAFIKAYVAERRGVSPSFEEIREHIGVASKSNVHRIVSELEERGHIKRKSRGARSIALTTVPGRYEVDLPHDVQTRLHQYARTRGISPERVIAELVALRLREA